MIKIQYQFKRETPLRFLGHLDQQRLFQRAFRRAQIPIEYSQGFNPHPKMSFALAMPVGLTSDDEVGEITVSNDMTTDDFIERMNAVLPTGLVIKTAKVCPPEAPSLSSTLQKSIYTLKVKTLLKSDALKLSAIISSFLAEPQVMIQKRNKKGTLVEKDIRPFIESIVLIEGSESDQVAMRMTLCYIDQQCVKPEKVLESINHFGDDVFQIDPTIEIHREKLIFNQEAGKF